MQHLMSPWNLMIEILLVVSIWDYNLCSGDPFTHQRWHSFTDDSTCVRKWHKVFNGGHEMVEE